ncbi:MAG: TolB family protein [Pyrinomonadaceae bacterium]
MTKATLTVWRGARTEKKILFISKRASERPNLWEISADGGEPNRLTGGKFHNVLPAWSPDGQTIYFKSNRSGENQLYKIPADGSNEPLQMTKNGAFQSFAAPDRNTVFYSKGGGANGLWSIRTDGIEEFPVPQLADAGYWRSWTLVPQGIYYLTQNSSDAEYEIRFYDFTTKQNRVVVTVDKPPLTFYSGLSASADEKQILYAQSDR